MFITKKAMVGSAAAIGFLALISSVAAPGEPEASDPFNLPAAVPLSEQAEALPTGTSREQPKEVTQATSTPNTIEPTAITKPMAEEPKPQPANPKPAPVPVRSAGADRDCTDFSSHEEAQRFFLANGGPSMDPHKLDRDNDGLACEST